MTSNKPFRRIRYGLFALVMCATAWLSSGCPELRDEAVNVIDNATREAINNYLDGLFDQFRSDTI